MSDGGLRVELPWWRDEEQLREWFPAAWARRAHMREGARNRQLVVLHLTAVVFHHRGARDGELYVAQAFTRTGEPGPVKVGLSADPWRRVKELAQGLPWELHLRGEWYDAEVASLFRECPQEHPRLVGLVEWVE